MFPDSTELLLIGCSFESIWIPRFRIILAQDERSSAKEAEPILKTKDSDKHSMMWWICNHLYACWRITQTIGIPSKIQKNSQWNRCSTYTWEIDIRKNEICGVKTINWESSSWKYLSLIGDEEVSSLQRTKVYVFSDSVLYLGKANENPQSNTAWKKRLTWLTSSSKYRALDKIDGESMEFEWNIFPGFTTLQLCSKVQELLLRLIVTSENFPGRVIFMSMFNDISRGSKDIKKKNTSQVLNSFLSIRRNLEQDNGHS